MEVGFEVTRLPKDTNLSTPMFPGQMENNSNNMANTNDSAAGIRVGIGSSTFHITGSVSFDRVTMAYLLWVVYVVAASWVITRLLCSPLAAPDDPIAMIALVLILLATAITATLLPHPDDQLPRTDNNGAIYVTNFWFF